MQLIFQNFEFALAGLLAVLMFFLPRNTQQRQSIMQLNFFDELAASLLNFLPEKYKHWLLTWLSYAGMQSNESYARLLAWKIYPSLAALTLALIVPLTFALIASVALFFVADIYVLRKAKSRQAEIAAALPQAIDLMLLGVDAGLGLDATLQRIAQDRSFVSNAINDELTKLGRDILLGRDRELAYRDLYLRSGVDELKSFGAALNQSSKMGISICKILRAQSQFIRMRQSQKAEEKAARLPIWMAFPLWFCIMPSLLLILLGPSLLLFLQRVAPLH